MNVCAYCLEFYDPGDVNSWVRDSRRYCSDKCRKQAHKENRKAQDRRISIDPEDFDAIQDLALETGDTRFNLVRKCIKIVLHLVEKDKLTVAAIRRLRLRNPGGDHAD